MRCRRPPARRTRPSSGSPSPSCPARARLAAQGVPDEMIARQLGLSVRTVRARFADAMAELGAQSRFQAGVEASRRGLLV
ncbi:LuxR C-terminal-related transcriptional regulator [Streptosporangium sp. NPDC048865]|uniref:LuxR C-terminal-related transcriptional regulator n=1 Tax=Streptosporangium sp. NPDC048865 TaxID=3155766 RepID=UPI00341F55DA